MPQVYAWMGAYVVRFLLIGAGAALGANARFMVSVWAAERFGIGFPYGTLIVNVTGSLLLGLLLELTTSRFVASPEMRLFLATGFLGAYTTFSTYAVESLALIRQGSIWLGLLDITSNIAVGLTFALLGIYLGRLLGA